MRDEAGASEAHIGPELFVFLRQLRENNERAWFWANKERYESEVRGPMLRFIADMGPRLAKISRHIVADARPVGGSLFRIQRDIRFSRDKSPYKLMAAAQFRHEVGRDVHAPGFYLNLEPSNVFAGAGLWHPDPRTLARVRAAIVARPRHWKQATGGLSLGGEALRRAPAGYDPSHPLIEELKRKDFVADRRFTEEEACEVQFIDRFLDACRAASPFMKFLTAALGVAW